MTQSGNYYQSVTTYECLIGHWFPDKTYNKTSLCQSNTQWEDPPPNCTGQLTETSTLCHANDVNMKVYQCSAMTTEHEVVSM